MCNHKHHTGRCRPVLDLISGQDKAVKETGFSIQWPSVVNLYGHNSGQRMEILSETCGLMHNDATLDEAISQYPNHEITARNETHNGRQVFEFYASDLDDWFSFILK